MTASAHDVAAELRRLLPDAGKVKIHKLLYYCQGHHLAHFGELLFREAIAAWDMGPVVEDLWRAERHGHEVPKPTRLGEAELNTIAYVASRYGKLTGRELELLSHGERPWRLADTHRIPGTSARIDNAVIRDYFEEADAADRAEQPVLDSDQVADMVAGAQERLRTQPEGRLMTADDIRAKLAELAAARG
jgi:uncharacterized phage-associated protein